MFKVIALIGAVLARGPQRYKEDREKREERNARASQFHITSGGGYFIDEDGNERVISQQQSDGRYDHLGQIPDLSLPTCSYLWIQIPFWKVIESPIRTDPEDYNIICQLIDKKGKVSHKNCDTRLEIFIDSKDVMTIYPLDGWVGQAQITLEAVNFNGEHDFTVFNVLVVECEADDEDCSYASSLDGQYWTKENKKCYKEPEVYLKYDKNQRFWLVGKGGKKHMVTYIDLTDQFLWVDDQEVARLWPSASERVPFADKSRHAVCFYETAKHKHYDDEDALERGYRPRGFVHFYQESPENDVRVHWSMTGLREDCWTEGHIHYKGDLHYDVLAIDAQYENVHINPYQGLHDENFEDDNKKLNRHMGDITLLKGDKYGRADEVRYDKLIDLYGDYSIYGRMCDVHFPKSCDYEDGWNSK